LIGGVGRTGGWTGARRVGAVHPDHNTACRSALLNLMALLQDRGFTREQAYVICSVAADLRLALNPEGEP